MKTLLIEIPQNKTLKEVKTLLSDNGISVVIDSYVRILKTTKTENIIKPSKKLSKEAREKIENDGMYKLMQEVDPNQERVSRSKVFEILNGKK